MTPKISKTIQIIGKICEEHRFREKLLFVPSYSIGHQIGEYLAKKDVSWINLRIAEQESSRDPFIRILVIRQKLYTN